MSAMILNKHLHQAMGAIENKNGLEWAQERRKGEEMETSLTDNSRSLTVKKESEVCLDVEVRITEALTFFICFFKMENITNL